MARMKAGAVLLLFSIFLANAAYCDNYYDGPPLNTIDGTVSSVDVMGSKITIKGVNSATFSVPINATIKQDLSDIKLSDIKSGDYVTIGYYDDASGKRQAQTITLDYRKDEGW